MNLAFLNQSTKLADADAIKIVQGIQLQIPIVTSLFGQMHSSVQFAKVAANGYYPIVFLDNSDQAGALGYHDVTPDGAPYGRVFVEPTLDNGGTILTGASSVAVTASHEAIETIIDPGANLWATTDSGRAVAYEGCDPCESDAYVVHLKDGTEVWLSDFVLPAWFIPGAPGPYDYLRKIKESFTIAEGGYAIIETVTTDSNETGPEPARTMMYGNNWDHRKDAVKLHSSSRTSWRLRNKTRRYP